MFQMIGKTKLSILCKFAAAWLGLLPSYTFLQLHPIQKHWSLCCAEIIWYHHHLMKTEHLSYFSAAKNTHNKLSSAIAVCHIVPDAKDISKK